MAPFAHATAAGQTLYVTGQMPTDTSGAVVGEDVAAQTDQVLANLLRVTELCGGGVADVVSVRAFLLDWDDYAAFNAAYARWFPDPAPEPNLCRHDRSGRGRMRRDRLGVLARRRLGLSSRPDRRSGSTAPRSRRRWHAPDLPGR